MNKLYDYLVLFDTYQNSICKRIQIGIVAHNAKEAKSIAKDMWYRDHTPHMFHLEAIRHKATPCTFKVLNYYVYR